MISKRYIVCDAETTGLDPAKDKVIELAGVVVENGKIIRQASTLIDPGILIPPEASAIHHLTDKDVSGKIGFDDAMTLWKLELGECDAMVAHNAAFDKSFTGDMGRVWLCTLRLARRLFPDFPMHTNQYLRYRLGLNVPAGPAHRALDDAMVTAHLLIYMLKRLPASAPSDMNQFILKVNAPLVLKTCRFGKHKDLPWAQVPKDYLQWCLKQDMDDDVLFTCKYYLERTV